MLAGVREPGSTVAMGAKQQLMAIRKRRGDRPILRITKSKGARGAGISVGNLILGYSSPSALGESVIRRVIANANHALMQDPGIVHIKDGKALTPHGEKLLNTKK